MLRVFLGKTVEESLEVTQSLVRTMDETPLAKILDKILDPIVAGPGDRYCGSSGSSRAQRGGGGLACLWRYPKS